MIFKYEESLLSLVKLKGIVLRTLFLLSFLFGFSFLSAQSATKGGEVDNFIQFGEPELKVSVYPNPVVSRAQIEVKGLPKGVKIEEVAIHSILGNQVLSRRFNNSSKIYLNVQSLRKGRYILRVMFSDNTSQVVSLVKS